MHQVGDEGLKGLRVAQDGENVEEDDALAQRVSDGQTTRRVSQPSSGSRDVWSGSF